MDADATPGADRRRGRARKGPRRMNEARLERIAVAHLERFGSSVANLRMVLRRRIAKSCDHHDDDPARFDAPLEELLVRLERMGLLDDRRYGESVVRIGRGRGQSGRAIRAKLRQKGLDPALCDELLGGGDSDADTDPEFEAAWRYARRRRIGPFRLDPELRREQRQRDLAALGRRGFGYGVAQSVIDGELEDDDFPRL